jgi:hypothetical protein
MCQVDGNDAESVVQTENKARNSITAQKTVLMNKFSVQ